MVGLELFNGITYNGFAILWVDCRKTPMAMVFFSNYGWKCPLAV